MNTLIMKTKHKFTTETLCQLILISGIILRIMYIGYTSVYTRQHDVESFSVEDDGHAAYILYLMFNKQLPDFDPKNAWQFYHPPLHHIISALFLSLIRKLGIPSDPVGYELLQILPCLYSSLFCIISYKTFKLIGIKDKALCYAAAFVTFHPTLIILSGSINNDMPAAFLSMSAIYFTVKWSKDKKVYDIIKIALSVALGMSSKLTSGLVAPAIAAVFIYTFIKNIKEYKRLILQFFIFGIICIPLGLFYPIRNYVKFGLPFNYVPKLSEDSSQYIDKGILSRLLNFKPFQFSSPFVQWGGDGAPYNEFNPTISLWKTSAFDGDTYFTDSITSQSFCTILFFSLVLLSCYSVYLLINIFIRKNMMNMEHKILIVVLSLTIYINYLVFCIKYPHVCTQNMRYCVPLIFTQAALFGCNEQSKFKEKTIQIFCVCSVIVYTELNFF